MITSISVLGCVQLAKEAHKQYMRNCRHRLWSLASYNRMTRINWMNNARYQKLQERLH